MGDGIGDFAFWLAMGLIGLGFLFGPLGSAVARWIDSLAGRRRLASGDDSEELRERVARLEGMETRLLELEERLDFAERVLAARRPVARIEGDTPPEPADVPR
jgi:hypothetical protein